MANKQKFLVTKEKMLVALAAESVTISSPVRYNGSCCCLFLGEVIDTITVSVQVAILSPAMLLYAVLSAYQKWIYRFN